MDSTDPGMIEPDKISLRQLIALLSNLRVTAWVSLGTLVLAPAAMMFRVGEEYQRDSTAILLDRPFGMVITQHALPAEYPFPSLVLSHAYRVKEDGSASKVVLTIRKRNAAGLYDTVGEVAAQSVPTKSLWDLLGQGEFGLPTAFAQPIRFDWGHYAAETRFRERFVSANTVRRFYDDGAILEYRVDGQGRSIESSLRWIRKPG